MRMTASDDGTRLDAGVLGRWLDANGAPGDGEEPILEQLSGGSQNTLYLIHRGSQRMVLRMPGARADAARIDGLLREIRLVRALRGTDVPHAELIAANDAGDLLGMPFYVMRAIDGWSPMDGGWPAPFDDDLTARRGLAFELVEGAAKLGRVDWRAQGLDGFGRLTAGWLSWTAIGYVTFPDWTTPPTGCAATGPGTTRRGSCTAITSSPMSCLRTVSRPDWPRSWTGR